MSKAARRVRGESQKKIVELIEGLSGRYSAWEIWQDFIVMSALSIANAFPHPKLEDDKAEYQRRAEKYTPAELEAIAQMFAETVNALEENPDQDFLGDLFMSLELGDSWKGQFFTPYCICQAMAEIKCGNIKDLVEEKNWISAGDPACGAGALLVAFANVCLRQKVNYQTSVLFVAQDIDFLAGCMCYIQLSLLGCPGYVAIADTLAHPAVSFDTRGLLPKENQRILYMPMFFSDIWAGRRICAKMDLFCQSMTVKSRKQTVKDPEPVPEAELKETPTGQLSLF